MLDGKVALITGAGRGIGRAIALEFAQLGARIVVNDYGVSLAGEREDDSPAHTVAAEIAARGGEAVANTASVTDFDATGAMIEAALKCFGRFDILVHVAGILRDRMLFNMSEEEWDLVLDVHLKGAFNTFRAASRVMRAERAGRIIAMSSDSALGSPGQPNYAAAKSGILGLVWSTALALEKYGVTTNAIMPTGATRMIDATPQGRETLEKEGRLASDLAAGTEQDPHNVAPLVAFLASDAAAGVNGQVFYSRGYSYARLQQPRLDAVVSRDRAWTSEELREIAGGALLEGMEAPFFGRIATAIGEAAGAGADGPDRVEAVETGAMTALGGRAAIVGVAESDRIGIVPDRSALQLHAEAARNALHEAGLTIGDVDGFFTAGIEAQIVAEYLGVRPSHVDGTSVGGSSFVIHVGHAAAAIANGLCEVALITHGESGRSRVGQPDEARHPQWPAQQFERPIGLPSPYGAYALACSRHMHLFGTKREELAEIAVATRKWAAMNPKAMYRDPITLDDVLASKPISYPFNLLDCCLVTDAGGAVVMTSLARARDCRTRPVGVLGFGEAVSHAIVSQMPDLTAGPARISGRRAFEMAGVGPADIDVAEVYDSFTYTVLVSLEDLGFCEKGEGGAFVSGQRTAPGGGFPLNTSGGGLSYTHPGMFGIFTVIEGVRQLRADYRDEGGRQVKEAELALVHGTGGFLSTAGTAILARL